MNFRTSMTPMQSRAISLAPGTTVLGIRFHRCHGPSMIPVLYVLQSAGIWGEDTETLVFPRVAGGGFLYERISAGPLRHRQQNLDEASYLCWCASHLSRLLFSPPSSIFVLYCSANAVYKPHYIDEHRTAIPNKKTLLAAAGQRIDREGGFEKGDRRRRWQQANKSLAPQPRHAIKQREHNLIIKVHGRKTSIVI